MKPSPELSALAVIATVTALMWVPYMLARILTRGATRTMADPANPNYPPDPPWAERARRAHGNAVQNLAVYAPLVLILALIGISTPVTVLASKVYLGARLVHYIVYAAGIPVLRTLAFVTGVAATLVIATAVFTHA
jgi:uncharacterized MAPEG superfamily protein